MAADSPVLSAYATTLLVVADFEQPGQRVFARYIIARMSGRANIVLSGHNRHCLADSERCLFATLSSSKYLACLCLAPCVVLLSDRVNFTRLKSNQRLIDLRRSEQAQGQGPASLSPKSLLPLSPFTLTVVLGSPDDARICLGTITRINTRLVLQAAACAPLFELCEIAALFESLTTDFNSADGPAPAFLFFEGRATGRSSTGVEHPARAPAVIRYARRNYPRATYSFISVYTREPHPEFDEISSTQLHIGVHDHIIDALTREYQGLVFIDSLDDALRHNLNANSRSWISNQNINLLLLKDDLDWSDFQQLARDPATYFNRVTDANYQLEEVRRTELAIVIPHFDTPGERLARCIASAQEVCALHEQTRIVVVDDGSAVDIRPELALMSDHNVGKVVWIRQDNRGLGAARNRAVSEVKADYYFFLDSDDTTHARSLVRLLTHAVSQGLEVCAGKRILVDEDGRFVADSLDYLYGGVFRSVDTADGNAFHDQMATNKLYARRTFFERSIWFDTGLYEDSPFSMAIYDSVRRIDFVNLTVYRWYKYGAGTTISSTLSTENLSQKIISLEKAWHLTSELQKAQKLRYDITVDLNRYFLRAGELSYSKARPYLDLLLRYCEPRLRELSTSRYSGKLGLLTESLLSKNGKAVHDVLALTATTASSDATTHANYMVKTHYHVLVAIACALRESLPSRIVLDCDQGHFSPGFIARLKSRDIFDDVIECRHTLVTQCGDKLLSKGHEAAGPILTILHNYYERLLGFTSASDITYVFDTSMTDWHYVRTRYRTVVKLEDGYGSHPRELRVDRKAGLWGRVLDTLAAPCSGACFSEVESKQVVSGRPAERPETPPARSGSPLPVTDIPHLFRTAAPRLWDELNLLYPIDIELGEHTGLIVTAPLYLSHCSVADHMALVAYMVERYGGCSPCIKPHPQDTNDYSMFGCAVIDRRFPLEVLNGRDSRVSLAVTFESSAIENLTIADELISLFPATDLTHAQVSAAISSILAGGACQHL